MRWSIATPVALMVGVGKGAEAGILIRGAEYLERSEKIDTVVVDKTGTITKGEASVTDIVPFKKICRTRDIVYRRLSRTWFRALSSSSSSERGKKEGRGKNNSLEEPKDFEAISGMGVKASIDDKFILFGNRKLMRKFDIDLTKEDIEKVMDKLESEGKTVLILAVNNEIAGLVTVADTVKETSAAAISLLNRNKIEVIMLTGYNEKTAKSIGQKVGINKIIANVLAGEKADVIKRLQLEEKKVVAMMGDGINDAPALAQADVGIAIGNGSDIAKETGGIILIKDDIMDVPMAIMLSRATMKKIKQNLFWALIYNAAGIPVAALGLLSPIIAAAAAMALSSISVTANSSILMRLKVADLK